MNFNLLIENIRTLNSIEQGDKICIFDEKIIIQKKSFFRPINRYYRCQTRYKTNAFIIELIRRAVEELSKYYFFTMNKSKLNKSEINIKNISEYNYYLNEINKIKDSLLILKKTYQNDVTFTRSLDMTIKLI